MRCRGLCILALIMLGTTIPSTAQVWGPLDINKCNPDGTRTVSARLEQIPQGSDDEKLCQNTPRVILGTSSLPDRCSPVRRFIFKGGERGIWKVADTSCQTGALPAPIPGGVGTMQSGMPLEGFADIHVHQM